jgi:uncharacterized damage-inducible protein DinB
MDIRYPIGTFKWMERYSSEERTAAIEDIATTPQKMRKAVEGLTDAQLDTPYRDGGWTVRQVVHHVADSHVNSYIRFKFALTEYEPAIKPYDEALWANLIDGVSAPIEPSLMLLDGLHFRWVLFLRSLSETDVTRKFKHPEVGMLTIGQYIVHYAWHGNHHIAHITSLRKKENW